MSAVSRSETNAVLPMDDGASDHLVAGSQLPSVPLAATDGRIIDLGNLPGLTVVYAYPRTSPPDGPPIDGWDVIPGARGCTPQSCSFRDHFLELRNLGVVNLFGLSTQDSTFQREAAARLHLPFPLLSDVGLLFSDAARLPVFEAGGLRLLKRLTMIVDSGRIEKIFYPVVYPERNAEEVMAWLRAPDRRGVNTSL
jgi:peroxiredoxin